MHLHRNVVIPVMLVAGAAIALPYAAMPVEARTTSVPSALARRAFSASRPPTSRSATPAPSSESQSDIPLPEGKGREVAQKKCSTCHAKNVWTAEHHTRDEWTSIVDSMVSPGLVASDDDLDTITDDLSQNCGPVTKPAPTTAPNAQPVSPANDSGPSKPSAR